MQSRKDRWQEDLFIASPLRDLVPEDHILKRVDRILDLSWLHDLVSGCYCQDNGRPSIDPESALRLMLAGFFEGIVQDRRLMRRAQTDLAFRWFAGYRLDESLPDRSSLTRIRQRWGDALFHAVFKRIVAQCVKAGLVNADTVHIDATLIRADVSWDSITTRHVDDVIEANREENDVLDDEMPPNPPEGTRGRPRVATPKPKKFSPTDPDATMATSCQQYHLEPTYKQHTAVEDSNGIIVDIAVTTGEASEGKHLLAQLDRIEATVECPVKTVTCDAGYAHGTNYAALEARNIDAVIPPQNTTARKKGTQHIPSRRFKYDARKDRVKCPAGKTLHRMQTLTAGNAIIYRTRSCDCQTCPLRPRCISPNAKVRTIRIGEGYAALLRARRRKNRGWDDSARQAYARHRWRVEGVHGRAKTHHGLRRAAQRGLANVRIQAYLTAAAMNLKRLAQSLNIGLERLNRLLHTLTRGQVAVQIVIRMPQGIPA